MSIINSTSKKSDKGPEVATLHKALTTLGFRVNKRELTFMTAGNDTIREVNNLLEKRGVAKVSSEISHEALAEVVNALKEQGKLDANQRFLVQGKVTNKDGLPAKRVQLVAFDIDLKGVAGYRQVKDLREIQKAGGFEILGQTLSRQDGTYTIEFYDWQYAKSERKKADVVVYALADTTVVGISEMVNAENYSVKGVVNDVDLTLKRNDQTTEYEQIWTSLNAFLNDSESSLLEIAGNLEQINFAAAEIDEPAQRVSLMATALELTQQISQKADISPNDDAKKVSKLAGVSSLEMIHQLLYGIGRNGTTLTWPTLLKYGRKRLSVAARTSMAHKIIKEVPQAPLDTFLNLLERCTIKSVLDTSTSDNTNDMGTMLGHALKTEEQKEAFLAVYNNFSGENFKDFWSVALPQSAAFKDKPELVEALLFSQQLTLLSGNYQPLVKELQVTKRMKSTQKLMEYKREDWTKLLTKTGVPSYVLGNTEQEKIANYAEVLESRLNAAFPTERIRLMAQKNELVIEKTAVSRALNRFLTKTKEFDISSSRVHDFEEGLKTAGGKNYTELRDTLMKVQRVYQVSPSPEAMNVLLENDLTSSHKITDCPRKTFMKRYGPALGGEDKALAVHQRASHISAKSEMNATYLYDFSQNYTPYSILDGQQINSIQTTLANNLPNYSELFGSPDVCECDPCKSVYSAAAYYVDLMRFLAQSELNDEGNSPLDILDSRRPDLVHLPLTCENTNTIIPYIDIANEVMEFYVENENLNNFEGFDTGDATAAELRANPQNTRLGAYTKLKEAKAPFSLPYHQPLDAIRIYSEHYKLSRKEVMEAVNSTNTPQEQKLTAIEAIHGSPEEYTIIAGYDLSDIQDNTDLHLYYGYTNSLGMVGLHRVREFIKRTGLAYTEVVDLLETRFINPHKYALDFLEKLFSYGSLGGEDLYNKLDAIADGSLNPATDADITDVLTAYNTDNPDNITPAGFKTWVENNFANFQAVITLFEPDSSCDLDTTSLMTISAIYTSSPNSGLTDDNWDKIHRFIRLARRLNISLTDLDILLTALGASDIEPDTIIQVCQVTDMVKLTGLDFAELAILWGDINTNGKKSTYERLFLNKALQAINPAFQPNAWGEYFTNTSTKLDDHISSIIAAFRISEPELEAIVGVSRITKTAGLTTLDLANDSLNLANLSTIYRHVVLAKAVGLKVIDFCTLIGILSDYPFSIWHEDNTEWKSIDTEASLDFIQQAVDVVNSGFKADTLRYILTGNLPSATSGLDEAALHNAIKSIRSTFLAIDQDHPAAVPAPITEEIIQNKLSLTFETDVVTQFMAAVNGTATYETITTANLPVTIPPALTAKYTYILGSGRLISNGVMTDAERTALKALAGVTPAFETAVDQLYQAPETLIANNFNGIFSNLNQAYETLLDHPAQAQAATLEQKLTYIYTSYVPILVDTLKKDSVIQNMALVTGLGTEITKILLGNSLGTLVSSLSATGFTGTYFNDNAWNNQALVRTDSTIDFDWQANAPDASVPANNFSVRWNAFITPPSSDEYTLVVEVKEADEAFNLYLDEVLVLQKAAANTTTRWELVTALNAAKLHKLTLEYAEQSQEAGITLSWKTDTTALAIIPTSSAYPATAVEAFSNQAKSLHRAAAFISGFELTDVEVNHFVGFPADFDNIDFAALTIVHWFTILEYANLRNSVPQAQALLTDVFVLANTSTPAPTVLDLVALTEQATAWDQTNLAFLVGDFNVQVADFKNAKALARIATVIEIARRTGISAQNIVNWGKVETDFNNLNQTAQMLKNSLKANRSEADWLELSGKLSNKLRENQQAALVSYLLTHDTIIAAGIDSADGLFEYFLIDVQMTACMDTSRIVQANAAVQMFIQRCMLNLESDRSTGEQKGIAPDAIDRDRWEWMKNYRVWEANRKVFLYPENWLEPEWRQDKSAFFIDLENYLAQNDITDNTVEEAFRDYLTSLDRVSKMDVVGMHRENYENGQFKQLHVVARTTIAPHIYYYRTWNEHKKWRPWEKLDIGIVGVEGTNLSGVHVLPVVWKNRLFIFWPEFYRKTIESTGDSDKMDDMAGRPLGGMTPREQVDIRLAWCERKDGAWTGKKLSKVLRTENLFLSYNESSFSFSTEIDSEDQTLYINTWQDGYEQYRYAFILTDPEAEIIIGFNPYHGPFDTTKEAHEYYNNFQKQYITSSKLVLDGKEYLKYPKTHWLIEPSNESKNDFPQIDLNDPFFYSDAQRNYFVRPVSVPVITGIKDPGIVEPGVPNPFTHIEFIPEWRPDELLDPWIRHHHKLDEVIPPLPEPGDPRFEEAIAIAERSRMEGNTTPMPGGMARSVMMRNRPAAGTSEIMSASSAFREEMVTEAITGEFATDTFDSEIPEGQQMIFMSKGHSTGGAFATGFYNNGFPLNDVTTGLEFHTFYHPFTSQFVTNLNQGGVSRGNKPANLFAPGLMESDTEIVSDEGFVFQGTYWPNSDYGHVLKPNDFANRTYYKENVCFDAFGANSIYNWELFFHAPLYLANRLSSNGEYEKAMKWFHYIFDPTTDELPLSGQSEVSRFWKVLPFKTTPSQRLTDWFMELNAQSDPSNPNHDPESPLAAQVAEWRDNPFDPHLIATNRPLAYMKNVVIKYVENIVAWGDSLFRQFTRESVNEALQLYVIANHILGPYPEYVPKRGNTKEETYNSLNGSWDAFSNALVELENIFPFSSNTPDSDSSNGNSLLGIGRTLYFCIPTNEKLLEIWDTVADRLFKIRHCMDINGTERSLALFAPPIDPAAIVAAAAQGLSLGSILADLSSPAPLYRFNYLVQKANDFTKDVKMLGKDLLGAMERKDAEAFSQLRAQHETVILNLTTSIREKMILDANVGVENLIAVRKTAINRVKHYAKLVGQTVEVPDVPSLEGDLNLQSTLPTINDFQEIKSEVDLKLKQDGNDDGDTKLQLLSKEKESLTLSKWAKRLKIIAGSVELAIPIMVAIPTLKGYLEPLGLGTGLETGGTHFAKILKASLKAMKTTSQLLDGYAAKAATLGGYMRREQQWAFQANLAASEIVAIDKQIVAAMIKVQVAEKELARHQKSIENAQEVETFIKDKFTNKELYQWMKEQLYSVYKRSFDLAFEMAKMAEKAYKYELGTDTANFIQYGYWDSSKEGLIAGDRLQLALRQMEKSYLDNNIQELELTKHVSLAQVNPIALLELKETGKCSVSLPEEIFDLDFQGHYFRRIKSVRMTIPAVAGPNTSVNCSLKMISNHIRLNTAMNSENEYEHENDEGIWIDDARFRSNNAPITAIAMSEAVNDDGLFQLDFKQERYMPFERAGAISSWHIELGGANTASSTGNEVLRQFDYGSISDVIIHIDYTARESGGTFKNAVNEYLKDYISNANENLEEPFMRLFDLKHEFSTEFHRMLNPVVPGGEQVLDITISNDRMPFLARERNVVVDHIELFARCTQTDPYKYTLQLKDVGGNNLTLINGTMTASSDFDGLHKSTITGAAVENMNINQAISLKVRHDNAQDFVSLATNPDEVEDLFMVLHYKLG